MSYELFEALENAKRDFWEQHAERRRDLNTALDHLKHTLSSAVYPEDYNETSKTLDKISQDLNSLLDDATENTPIKEDHDMSPTITTLHHPEVIEMLSAWATKRLEHFINVMPNGQFMNGHNQKMENCDGIVMLASGEVCPIFHNSICCLNPLSTERHDDYAYLSTFSVAGNIIPDATSMTKTVEKYNRDQNRFLKNRDIGGFGRYAIIAYHSFKQGW